MSLETLEVISFNDRIIARSPDIGVLELDMTEEVERQLRDYLRDSEEAGGRRLEISGHGLAHEKNCAYPEIREVRKIVQQGPPSVTVYLFGENPDGDKTYFSVSRNPSLATNNG